SPSCYSLSLPDALPISFIYGLAIEDGLIHSASLLRDVPRYFTDYQPENFTRHFSGPVSATEALRQSLNLPVVQVLEAVTPERFRSEEHTSELQSRENLV